MANKIWAATSNEITEREIKNAELAGKLAGECMVLLRNDETLPIKTGPVALYGNGARFTIKGGTGSGDVNTRSNTNIETGLKEGGFEITTSAWINRNEEARNQAKAEYLKWAEAESKKTGIQLMWVIFDHPFGEPDIVEITDEDIKASNTDTAIFVISRNSGEGADRKNEKGDYQLWPTEISNIKKLVENYKKVIIVLNVGGLIDMSELSEMPGINSILLMSQLGNLGGKILADVLKGEVNPSGRLSDTWAKDYMDYPSSAEFSFNNGNVHEDYYRDGIYVGYRYFDSFEKQVVYPFGYGLSYSDFESKVTSVVQNGNKVDVEVEVQNIGRYAGKDVVQLYVSAPVNAGGIEHPYQELKGFAKTAVVQPGEKAKVTVSVALESLASYNEKSASWVIGAGDYVVRVGKNSRDTVAAVNLSFEKDVVTEKCKNILPLDCEMQEIKADVKPAAPAKDTLKIDVTKIPCKTHSYQNGRPEIKNNRSEKLTLRHVIDGKCTVEELVAQLTVEEMATMCVGVFYDDKKSSVIGSASSVVPGAAGETPSILYDRNVPKLILADGPAGVRLQPHFRTDKDHNYLPGGEVFGDQVNPFGPAPEGAIDYYQYCTAIPIGWALAQSWNCPLIEEIGQMIGKEMELFGVDMWLAPAQNIHRNPLCGRNFEYYSEDPLLTGKISAAITKGVQAIPGRCTTIKHFAVNNQEENRYFVNAHVSERALREIYLKGFEIAVKESSPMSIMTSYNLLNGTHTANQYDMIQSACRDEWGFDGVIMTDWFTSVELPNMTGKYEHHYPISASTGCIFAGNDLQMPGCQKNIDDIVEGVKTGKEIDGYKITKGDLQFCTANLLKVMVRLNH